MIQYYNIKKSIQKKIGLLFLNFLIIFYFIYLNRDKIKFDYWYDYIFILLLIIITVNGIGIFKEKREVVLEHNDNHILFKDIEVKVSWKEIKKVELVYKTFSSIIRVTTSKKIEFTKKRNLLKRFFSMLRMPKMEHVITIYVDKMEGDYLEIFEDIETTFYKNR